MKNAGRGRKVASPPTQRKGNRPGRRALVIDRSPPNC